MASIGRLGLVEELPLVVRLFATGPLGPPRFELGPLLLQKGPLALTEGIGRVEVMFVGGMPFENHQSLVIENQIGSFIEGGEDSQRSVEFGSQASRLDRRLRSTALASPEVLSFACEACLPKVATFCCR